MYLYFIFLFYRYLINKSYKTVIQSEKPIKCTLGILKKLANGCVVDTYLPYFLFEKAFYRKRNI